MLLAASGAAAILYSLLVASLASSVLLEVSHCAGIEYGDTFLDNSILLLQPHFSPSASGAGLLEVCLLVHRHSAPSFVRSAIVSSSTSKAWLVYLSLSEKDSTWALVIKHSLHLPLLKAFPSCVGSALNPAMCGVINSSISPGINANSDG